MKALVKKSPERGIWLDNVPTPTCSTNDVKIKITHTAICGTDLHIYKWDEWSKRTINTPLVTGHEFCGIVEEIGPGVTHFKIGDRVSGEGHITCGYCRNCRAGKRHLCHKTVGIGIHREGAFAEYLVMPEFNVWGVHNDIPSEIAAIFDPFGNAAHTALSFEMVGEDVLITGAGPIGIMAVAICNYVGARHIVITDVNDFRLELAKKMGATKVINVSRDKIKNVISELGISNGFDVGLEMSGNSAAFKSMLENMYHGGRIALLGLLPESTQINWDDIIFKGLHVKGIYGREMFETWHDFQKGFDIMESGNCGKVVLEW
jgi:threonine 3-dehydrogenase